MLKFLLSLAVCTSVVAVPNVGPTVKLDSATITGIRNGSVTKFLGIPYAHAPTGNRRFRPAEPVPPYKGYIQAEAYGPACPQQKISSPFKTTSTADPQIAIDVTKVIASSPELHVAPGPESEDCLSINVIKPTSARSTEGLPVIVWIYGGGYLVGDTAAYDAMGVRIVRRSVELGQPVVFVSMNYRVSAYGFLAGKEVLREGVGNLGLRDQRTALYWIRSNLSYFDLYPSFVRWGQSSGATSVALQMLAYGGHSNNLFRAGFMQSGHMLPVANITDGQVHYDQLVADTGCSRAHDSLACLRSVDYSLLKAAVNKSPDFMSRQSLIPVWTPRADGDFLTDSLQNLVKQGSVVKVPIVFGNCEDEGTIFSMSTLDMDFDADFRAYIKSVWFPKANAADLELLWSHYSSDPSNGSPFYTGRSNTLTIVYKRLAAFQGDIAFQAPRRSFLQGLSGKQKLWTYSSSVAKISPVFAMGAFHGSDLMFNVLDDYVVRFATNLDPNNGTGVDWLPYTTQSPQIYLIPDSDLNKPLMVLDTYRDAPMKYLTNLSLAYPF
ncbi:carotenoid ester lipase precursor [Crassisporium funariophilum]|nr:carotenoid ester lipase precursor [Crassisporium funariophilum]